MAKYQLKIMINTSIPTNVGFTELTSDILLYEPPKGNKKNLVKYPFFDPDAIYPRKIIQNLEYSKRIEIFFNKEKFESVVLEYSFSMRAKGKDYEDKHTLASSNFEFTLQTLLSAGFGGYNFSTSLDFYDPYYTGKLLSMKGSNSDLFPFFSRRFDRTFSYLKIGGSVYTVIGLIWINDAFNHPLYSSVVGSYKTYNEDKNPDKIRKTMDEIKEKLQRLINIFCLDMIINPPTSFLDQDYSRSNNRFGYNEKADTLRLIQEKFKNINEVIVKKLKVMVEDFKKSIESSDDKKEVNEVLEQLKMQTRYANEPKDTKTTWFIKTGIMENDRELPTKLNAFKQEFIAQSLQLNDQIRFFLKSDLELIGRTLLNTDFVSFYRKVRVLEYELRANEYLLKNEDFSHDSEEREIQAYITKTYNKSQNFTNSLRKLTENRIFGNVEWENETNKYIKNEKTKLQKSEESKNMFEELLQCEDEHSAKCTDSPDFLKYLNTGLDEIIVKNSNPVINGTQTYNMFEAYVQINVAKGKVTTLNYSGIKCAYLNFSLGNMFKASGALTKKNYLVKKKVYFDFETQLEEINKLVETQKKLEDQKIRKSILEDKKDVPEQPKNNTTIKSILKKAGGGKRRSKKERSR